MVLPDGLNILAQINLLHFCSGAKYSCNTFFVKFPFPSPPNKQTVAKYIHILTSLEFYSILPSSHQLDQQNVSLLLKPVDSSLHILKNLHVTELFFCCFLLTLQFCLSQEQGMTPLQSYHNPWWLDDVSCGLTLLTLRVTDFLLVLILQSTMMNFHKCLIKSFLSTKHQGFQVASLCTILSVV